MGWPKGVPRGPGGGMAGSYSKANAARTPEKKQADLIRAVEKAYLSGAIPMLDHVDLGGCRWCDLLAILHAEQYDLTVLRLARTWARRCRDDDQDLTYDMATA